MRRCLFLNLLLAFVLWAVPAQAEGRFIVRVNGGISIIQAICAPLGCNVAETLDGTIGELFLVTAPDSIAPVVLQVLNTLPVVVDVEPDLIAHVAGSTYTVPPALSDTTPVNYFGTTVPEGYVHQPATSIVRLAQTQSAFSVAGSGVVAIIDTGVDPNHPALEGVLVPGYDFTRNQSGEADETQDVALSSPPDTDGSPQWTNSNTAAVLSQSTAAVVDGNPQYGEFGHGTMVAGIVHLVAPEAKIMPLKAFLANGTGYTSDILRAIYFAVQNWANVLNMSFNLAAYSTEVKNALDYATLNRVVSVAAAGNSGEQTLVYPAALPNVMGIASTTNTDQLSSFSNYGPQLVWVGAPGEGVVTTYPYGTYAAGWGTSFSTPFVTGTVALMMNLQNWVSSSQTAQAAAHAQPETPALGHGRLDTFQALQAWRNGLGIP
ncbi:MAG: S8 family serine peptidase [Bryobacteraceae bacterium]